jgi:hypothetical protein
MLTSLRMGAASWIALALLVFVFARIVPPGRRHDYLIELSIALTAAVAFGAIATAADFGGWRALDWRAALFVFFGAATAVGAYRAVRLATS